MFLLLETKVTDIFMVQVKILYFSPLLPNIFHRSEVKTNVTATFVSRKNISEIFRGFLVDFN